MPPEESIDDPVARVQEDVMSILLKVLRFFTIKYQGKQFIRWYKPKSSVSFFHVLYLKKEEAGKAVVKVPGRMIKSKKNLKGHFTRNSLVKVMNRENDEFAILRVQGDMDSKAAMLLDYDTRLLLDIQDSDDLDLQMFPASTFEGFYLNAYMHPDFGSRAQYWTAFMFFIYGTLVLPFVTGMVLKFIM